MIDKTQCMYLFLLLYGGAILALFVRAFVRRRLLEYLKNKDITRYRQLVERLGLRG